MGGSLIPCSKSLTGSKPFFRPWMLLRVLLGACWWHVSFGSQGSHRSSVSGNPPHRSVGFMYGKPYWQYVTVRRSNWLRTSRFRAMPLGFSRMNILGSSWRTISTSHSTRAMLR